MKNSNVINQRKKARGCSLQMRKIRVKPWEVEVSPLPPPTLCQPRAVVIHGGETTPLPSSRPSPAYACVLSCTHRQAACTRPAGWSHGATFHPGFTQGPHRAPASCPQAPQPSRGQAGTRPKSDAVGRLLREELMGLFIKTFHFLTCGFLQDSPLYPSAARC